MSWTVARQEFEAVTSLPGDRRYLYCVKKVADWEELWSLRDEGGWALTGTPEGAEAVPIWPHTQYARACATEQWCGCEPASMPLDAWIEKWTPGMERDARLVAVFPTATNRGVVVDPKRFARDILEERAKYA